MKTNSAVGSYYLQQLSIGCLRQTTVSQQGKWQFDVHSRQRTSSNVVLSSTTEGTTKVRISE